MKRSALSAFAIAVRSSSGMKRSSLRVSTTSMPSALSLSASLRATPRTMSFSAMPSTPIAPGSLPPVPGIENDFPQGRRRRRFRGLRRRRVAWLIDQGHRFGNLRFLRGSCGWRDYRLRPLLSLLLGRGIERGDALARPAAPVAPGIFCGDNGVLLPRVPAVAFAGVERHREAIAALGGIGAVRIFADQQAKVSNGSVERALFTARFVELLINFTGVVVSRIPVAALGKFLRQTLEARCDFFKTGACLRREPALGKLIVFVLGGDVELPVLRDRRGCGHAGKWEQQRDEEKDASRLHYECSFFARSTNAFSRFNASSGVNIETSRFLSSSRNLSSTSATSGICGRSSLRPPRAARGRPRSSSSPPSRFLRISLARSTTSGGRPASFATWMP